MCDACGMAHVGARRRRRSKPPPAPPRPDPGAERAHRARVAARPASRPRLTAPTLLPPPEPPADRPPADPHAAPPTVAGARTRSPPAALPAPEPSAGRRAMAARRRLRWRGPTRRRRRRAGDPPPRAAAVRRPRSRAAGRSAGPAAGRAHRGTAPGTGAAGRRRHRRAAHPGRLATRESPLRRDAARLRHRGLAVEDLVSASGLEHGATASRRDAARRRPARGRLRLARRARAEHAGAGRDPPRLPGARAATDRGTAGAAQAAPSRPRRRTARSSTGGRWRSSPSWSCSPRS